MNTIDTDTYCVYGDFGCGAETDTPEGEYDQAATTQDTPVYDTPCIQTRVVTTRVVIDSKSRDVSVFPRSESYTVELDREYTNVKDVTLVSSEFPNVLPTVRGGDDAHNNNVFAWQRWRDACFRVYDVGEFGGAVCATFAEVPPVLRAYISEEEDTGGAVFSGALRAHAADAAARGVPLHAAPARVPIDAFTECEHDTQSALWNFFDRGGRCVFAPFAGRMAKVVGAPVEGTFSFGRWFLHVFFLEDVQCGFDGLQILLGVQLLRTSHVIGEQFPHIECTGETSVTIKCRVHGVLQVVMQDGDENNTFTTREALLREGRYDAAALAAEVSAQMNAVAARTGGATLRHAVTIDDTRHTTRVSCAREYVLGAGAVMHRSFFPALLRFHRYGDPRRLHVVVLRLPQHGLCEQDIIEVCVPDMRHVPPDTRRVLARIAGMRFCVHLLRMYRIEKPTPDGPRTVFRDAANQILDVSDFDGPRALLPIVDNYVYIDLEEHIDASECEQMMSGSCDVGMSYCFAQSSRDYYDVTGVKGADRVPQPFGVGGREFVAERASEFFSVRAPPIVRVPAANCDGGVVHVAEPLKLALAWSRAPHDAIGARARDTCVPLVLRGTCRTVRHVHTDVDGVPRGTRMTRIDTAHVRELKAAVPHNLHVHDTVVLMINREPRDVRTCRVLDVLHDCAFVIELIEEWAGRECLVGVNAADVGCADDFVVADCDAGEMKLDDDGRLCIHAPEIVSFFYKNDVCVFTIHADTDCAPVECVSDGNGGQVRIALAPWNLYFARAQMADDMGVCVLRVFRTMEDALGERGQMRFVEAGRGAVVLSRTGVARLRVPNHGLQTFVNTVYLCDCEPYEGEYMVYRHDKDHFFVSLRREAGGHAPAFDAMNAMLTSDRHGFFWDATNLRADGTPQAYVCARNVADRYVLLRSRALGCGLHVAGATCAPAAQPFGRIDLPADGRAVAQDTYVCSTRTFDPTPLPSLRRVDVAVVRADGRLCDLKNTEHSFVIEIREYIDSTSDTGFSTRRGLFDRIDVHRTAGGS